MPRYTDDQISAAASDADSILEVMRRLEIKMTGGSHGHIKMRMQRLGIDITAMARRGRAWNAGKTFLAKRRTPESILVLRKRGRRQYAKYLRRALLAIGRVYCCEGCGNKGEWMGKSMTLQVDHRNRNWLDDREKNLRFVCPNCHTIL